MYVRISDDLIIMLIVNEAEYKVFQGPTSTSAYTMNYK